MKYKARIQYIKEFEIISLCKLNEKSLQLDGIYQRYKQLRNCPHGRIFVKIKLQKNLTLLILDKKNAPMT